MAEGWLMCCAACLLAPSSCPANPVLRKHPHPVRCHHLLPLSPAARFTWGVIQRRRAASGTAVLLTTHSMEEADLLADGIAIMAQGRWAAGRGACTHRGCWAACTGKELGAGLGVAAWSHCQ